MHATGDHRLRGVPREGLRGDYIAKRDFHQGGGDKSGGGLGNVAQEQWDAIAPKPRGKGVDQRCAHSNTVAKS